ncbi:LamG domain-containing protein [Paenibacillus thermotolerans]|uniref:LamG domain-containing protein n=1 Tax=Paenibacillus thermotolerans TaxID=3027807 RepID=UPI002367D165|nr:MULTISPECIES: LamG domain-containing protein [unclassified Paenibacillus]
MDSLREGLVGHYLFDGNVEDTSGFGRHGRAEGITYTADRFGETDGACAFSGNGDHVVVTLPPALDRDAFSVSVWAKYDEQAALKGWNSAIISQDDNGLRKEGAHRVFQLSTKGALFVWHRMMGGRDPIAKQPIQPGVWYHIAAVYREGRHSLYVNGMLQDEQPGSFAPSADEPIYIGKKNSNEPRFWFRGALDDLRMYDRALSEREVSALYTENGYTGDPQLAHVPARESKAYDASAKFPAKKLLERQAFNWNDCYNSFALALHGAMLYTSKPLSLPQALVYTGQAFSINTNESVMPMDVFGDGSLLREAMDNLGFDIEVLSANLYGGDWEEHTVERALDIVRESIGRGFAVVGWNLDNYEHGLIYGYDDERRILHIHDINARGGGELSYDDFGRRPRNGQPINPEMFVLALKERNDRPHVNVTRYSEEEDASYRKTLSKALALAIRHIDDKGGDGSVRKNGIAAIDAWITAFEEGTAHRFFTSYNLLWITSSRQYLVPFFIQSSITHCMSIQDPKLQQLMLKASDVYLSSYRAWVSMREMFPFPHSADPADPVLKAEAIRLLREAREAEVAGLAVLREMVKHLTPLDEELGLEMTEGIVG